MATQPGVGLLLAACSAAPLAIWWFGRNKEVKATWRRYAESRGGVFHELSQGGVKKQGAIEVDEGEARVYVDITLVEHGSSREIYTRLRAYLQAPCGPTFKVMPTINIGALVSRAFKKGDPKAEPRLFMNELYRVDDDPHGVVPQIIPDAVQDVLLRPEFMGSRVSCDGEVLQLLVRHGIETEAELDITTKIVGEMATTDLFGLGVLKALPGAEYLPPKGPWDDRTVPCVELLHGDCDVTIGPVGHEGRAHTSASNDVALEQYDLTVEVTDDGLPEGEEELPRLPDGALPLLASVGPGSLHVSEGVADFHWNHIERIPARLQAGASLVAAFVAPPASGPFR